MFPKYFFPFLLLIIFFSSSSLAQASVIINEVQLFPTEERFLELYNTGDLTVDLTNWYMQRKTATGNSFGSLVSKTNFGNKTIGARDYFVISRKSLDNSDIILDNLTLTESNTIQIKNSNEEVVDKVGWGNSNDCAGSCPPNPPEGQSIQKTGNNSWVLALPTPRMANATTTLFSSTALDSDDGFSAASATETKTKIIEIPKIKTKITAQALAFSGISVSFQASAFGYNKEQLYYGKYFWNFGDGDSKEIKANGISEVEKLTHTYFYPGEYNVTLEYYANYYGNVPDASDRITIKIVPADILISRVGDEKDFFVELDNNASYDADISKWVLSSSGKSFTMPRNTVIGSKKKIIFSQKITNFSVSDRNSLKLLNPQGELVFDYSASILAPIAAVPTKVVAQPKPQIFTSQNQKNSPAIKPSGKPLKHEGKTNSLADLQIPVGNLEASIMESDIATGNPWRTYILTTILTILIGASAGAVYFIRQKKIISSAGDDFKILDE